jgi:predicted ATP-dependent endonuclease of OLD family
MLIRKIKVQNFRLLKNFSIDLEEDLSLIIGKNNTGKTSLLSLLESKLSIKSDKFPRLSDFKYSI